MTESIYVPEPRIALAPGAHGGLVVTADVREPFAVLTDALTLVRDRLPMVTDVAWDLATIEQRRNGHRYRYVLRIPLAGPSTPAERAPVAADPRDVARHLDEDAASVRRALPRPHPHHHPRHGLDRLCSLLFDADSWGRCEVIAVRTLALLLVFTAPAFAYSDADYCRDTIAAERAWCHATHAAELADCMWTRALERWLGVPTANRNATECRNEAKETCRECKRAAEACEVRP